MVMAAPPQYKQIIPTQPPLYVEHLAHFVLYNNSARQNPFSCAPDRIRSDTLAVASSLINKQIINNSLPITGSLSLLHPPTSPFPRIYTMPSTPPTVRCSVGAIAVSTY
eukprot:scaffold26105_cov50-Attheya_sp.AAC.1